MAISISYPKAQAKVEPVANVALDKRNIEPTTTVAPKAVKLRKALAALESVTQTTLSNAARQARWRKAHPEKHADAQKARWGRRRASTGKAGE